MALVDLQWNLLRLSEHYNPQRLTIDNSFLSIENVDERTEYLFIIWNFFTTSELEAPFVCVNGTQIPKKILYETLISNRLLETFFENNVLSHVDGTNVDFLAAFLLQILVYLLNKHESINSKDAACLSNLILLSWWNRGFCLPSNYCTLAERLHMGFLQLMPLITSNFISQLVKYPDHGYLFAVNLLGIYADFADHTSGHEDSSQGSPNLQEDLASRLLGLHASAPFQMLSNIHRKSHHLYMQHSTTVRFSTLASADSTPRLADILNVIVSSARITEALRQHSDLPLPSESDCTTLRNRFINVRDLFLARACRFLAAEQRKSIPDLLQSRLISVIHAAAPKHLVSKLLNSTPTDPVPISDSDTHCSQSQRDSSDLHRQLICWSIERKLNVAEYALWFVSFSEVRDVNSAHCILTRLLRHASLLARDHVFSLSLVQRMDRVRKAALPEQLYLKLLRRILSHLSTDSKCKLLQGLHSSVNASGASPLPKTSNLFDTRIRTLFNRLVVVDNKDVQNSKTETSNKACTATPNFDDEFVLDCELLLLTRPVPFLRELILLPVTRRCPVSETAVHQLLVHLSYSLSIPIGNAAESPRSSADCSCSPDGSTAPTILELLLLKDLSTKQPLDGAPSLIQCFETWEEENDFAQFDPLALDSFNVFPGGDEVESWLPVEFTSIISIPMVQTIAHILKLAPLQIPRLIARLLHRLQTLTHVNPPLIVFERLILLYLAAIEQLTSDVSMDFSCSYLTKLVCQLIDLFDFMFLTENTPFYRNNSYKIDCFLAWLLSRLAVKLFPNINEICCRCRQIKEKLSHQPVNFRVIRFWALLLPILNKFHSRESVVYLTLDDKFCEVISDLEWLIPEAQLRLQFGLSYNPTSRQKVADASNNHGPVSPRTLILLFNLAAASTDSFNNIVHIVSEVKPDLLWDDHGSPSNSRLLLALLMFLSDLAGARQPERWIRVVSLVDHLVRIGTFILAFQPVPVNFQCSINAFLLVDYNAIRGAFDVFALFSDLLHICSTRPCVENNQRKEHDCRFRLLFQTMIPLTQRLAHRVDTVVHSADVQPAFKRFVQTQSECLMVQLERRVEIAFTSCSASCQDTCEIAVHRLRLTIHMIHNKHAHEQNTAEATK
ncbi:hypothetical protein PHET_05251 [Paragonimus heterotremus]|uniref:Uncharacterized protein n=1 Tax=Paragonimus heterotremus TaxID=100268 RepID=A0A8J4TGG1_9TREM|nr:hypothetical protein PHET_05251 [Paragonimus heterotremus]